jgi:membrane associated rhomboid family serine protease
MLIPIRHENMSARRWPVITLGLIALNIIVFVFTRSAIDGPQEQQTKTARLHLIILAATHPELTVPASVQKMLATVQENNPKEWEYLKNDRREVVDGWDTKTRLMEEPAELQAEMDSLASQYSELQAASLLQKYAFIPAERHAITYLTANFLHGGWLHLIGNMWFLWLAGFVLEDLWGRPLYAAFYLIAGVAALQFYAWTNTGSMTPLVGASGAVAGLMGGFLVRFPKMKIQMRWILGIRSLLRGGYEFSAPAYALLPLWLLTEVFYGSLFGKVSGVAHWAHVGGFVFGALVAMGVRYSGLEHLATKSVEEQMTWTSDPEIARASDLMEKGQIDEAVGCLQGFVSAKPDSVDACSMLQQAYWRKGDVPEYLELTKKLCALHLKARENDLAWQDFEEYLNSGGGQLPADTWFDLCRVAEGRQDFVRALDEYQKLIAAYPTDRRALQAQIASGRICLKNLDRPQDALKFYETAAASPIPHLDWEQTIAAAIREAKKALEAPVTAASPGATH